MQRLNDTFILVHYFRNIHNEFVEFLLGRQLAIRKQLTLATLAFFGSPQVAHVGIDDVLRHFTDMSSFLLLPFRNLNLI